MSNYSRTVRYEVDAECITPLRTGASVRDTETVLQERSGRLLLQGSSLAGAMRDWLCHNGLSEEAKELFGSEEQGAGCLMVSTALFDTDATVDIRPRVAINRKTGVVDGATKFDMAHINAGAHFHFSLIWLGTAETEASHKAVIVQLLSALHSGAIRLGGQKSNGFGRVSLQVWSRDFDLTDPTDRDDWVNIGWDLWSENKKLDLSAWKLQPLELPETAQSQVIFTVNATFPQLIIKSGSSVFVGHSRYDEQLHENGRALIPGSSIKGVVLSRLRIIASALGVEPSIINDAFGRGPEYSAELGKRDKGMPGLFRFDDAYPEVSKASRINRIRINRVTGGTVNSALFCQEPIAGSLTLHISGPAAQDTGRKKTSLERTNSPKQHGQICALMLYSLRDLALGIYNLGSGWAVGRGTLQVTSITAQEGDRRLTMTFDAAHRAALEDPDGLAAEWIQQLGGNSK